MVGQGVVVCLGGVARKRTRVLRKGTRVLLCTPAARPRVARWLDQLGLPGAVVVALPGVVAESIRELQRDLGRQAALEPSLASSLVAEQGDRAGVRADPKRRLAVPETAREDVAERLQDHLAQDVSRVERSVDLAIHRARSHHNEEKRLRADMRGMLCFQMFRDVLLPMGPTRGRYRIIWTHIGPALVPYGFTVRQFWIQMDSYRVHFWIETYPYC